MKIPQDVDLSKIVHEEKFECVNQRCRHELTGKWAEGTFASIVVSCPSCDTVQIMKATLVRSVPVQSAMDD